MNNNVYPCKPQFYYIKVGFKGGSKLYRYIFVMYEWYHFWSHFRMSVRVIRALKLFTEYLMITKKD